ncbi:MAG: hypothetical protein ISR65_10790 [Bacteriovoracaceae bacterium]|nr:hypothetical protein [Bacteriovoracaceae bacterium]
MIRFIVTTITFLGIYSPTYAKLAMVDYENICPSSNIQSTQKDPFYIIKKKARYKKNSLVIETRNVWIPYVQNMIVENTTYLPERSIVRVIPPLRPRVKKNQEHEYGPEDPDAKISGPIHPPLLLPVKRLEYSKIPMYKVITTPLNDTQSSPVFQFHDTKKQYKKIFMPFADGTSMVTPKNAVVILKSKNLSSPTEHYFSPKRSSLKNAISQGAGHTLLEIATNENGEYLTCCLDDSKTHCEQPNYFFNLLKTGHTRDNTLEVSNAIVFDPKESDDLISGLDPVSKNSVIPLLHTIKNLLHHDGDELSLPIDRFQRLYYQESKRGRYFQTIELFRPPLVQTAQNHQLFRLAIPPLELKWSSYHEAGPSYIKSNFEKHGTDSYLQAYSLCAFTAIIKEWETKLCTTEGCAIIWYDLFSPKGVDHSSHYHGECIDIKPFRKKDDLEGIVGWKSARRGRYDRKKTKKFLKYLRKMGATNRLFNDPKIWYAKAHPQHDSHIHFCLPIKSAKIQKLCTGSK